MYLYPTFLKYKEGMKVEETTLTENELFDDGEFRLLSVTKYIETWSIPVNIFKIFERVQYIAILIPSAPNSMLCLRFKLPE